MSYRQQPEQTPLGLISEAELAAAQRAFQEDQRRAAHAAQPTQPPAPAPHVATEHTRTNHRGVKVIALVAGLGVAGYLGYDLLDDRSPSTPPAATVPLKSPSMSASPAETTDAAPSSTAAASPTAAPANSFTPAVLGCVPAADIAIQRGEAGIKWVGIYKKTGDMYATNAQNFIGQVTGTLKSDVCLNTDTIAFDQALTDQNGGVATYTYDAATMRFTVDPTGITNGVRMYERDDILRSLKADNKKATMDDVKHLAQTIHDKTEAVAKINGFFLYHKLATRKNFTALVQAGESAVQSAYATMAAAQGFSTGTIIFTPANAPTAEAMTFDTQPYPELSGVCDNYQPNASPFTCYEYKPKTGKWRFAINPPTAGVAQ